MVDPVRTIQFQLQWLQFHEFASFFRVTRINGANSRICNLCNSEYIGIRGSTMEIKADQNVIFMNVMILRLM